MGTKESNPTVEDEWRREPTYGMEINWGGREEMVKDGREETNRGDNMMKWFLINVEERKQGEVEVSRNRSGTKQRRSKALNYGAMKEHVEAGERE